MPEPAASPPFVSLSILIVDDEDPVREMLSWMLEEAGHVVFEAGNGLQALNFLDQHGPVDIVLSDINMPGIDGVELSCRVHQQWPELPVLLISGRPPPEGARPFLPKPFRWDTLAQAIQCLSRRGSQAGQLA